MLAVVLESTSINMSASTHGKAKQKTDDIWWSLPSVVERVFVGAHGASLGLV